MASLPPLSSCASALASLPSSSSSVVALVVMALWQPWVLLAVIALPVASRALRVVRAGTTGPGLVPVLAATGLYEVAYAVLVLVGVVVGAAAG